MTNIGYRSLTPYMLAGPLVAAALMGSSVKAHAAAELPEIKPEAVGFSSERLRRLDSVMQKMVDDGEFSGVVTMAARHGKVFQSKAYGLRDLASRAPMERDTIFRLASMSKPITGVAMMILYEEGKWRMDEPISTYIPEFANLKVFKGLDANSKILVEDPEHPPTMRELMSHTAGFSYGGGDGPVDKLYKDDNGNNIVLGASSLQEMINQISKIPLLCQPGTRFVYSVSVDIQGYLVQKLSSKPLAEFLKERIFEPLGMKDTDFFVPKEKWGRFATLYKKDGSNKAKLDVVPESDPMSRPDGLKRYDLEPGLPSGGGGLVSTGGDYLKFAQMLLNEGVLGGARILAPETVWMMRTNQLPDTMTAKDWTRSDNLLPYGWGFGLDFAVFENSARVERPVGKGTFFWGGAFGTWFWIDPTDDVVFVGMVQRWNSAFQLQWDLAQQTSYQALIDLKK